MTAGRAAAARPLLMVLLGLALALGLAPAAPSPASGAAQRERVGPECVPPRLNLSDVLPGTGVQVNPLPDSADAPNTTQISFLGAPASALSHISVSGSVTGSHPGRLQAYSQGDGASFLPARAFRPRETVTVRGRVAAGGRSVPFAFHFSVALRDPIGRAAIAAQAAKAGELLSFHSRPDLRPPKIAIHTSLPGQESGDVFVAVYSGPSRPGPTIFDSAGNLVWYDPLRGSEEAADLKLQTWEGHPVLSWWQGYIVEQGFGQGEVVLADSAYQQVAKFTAGNGLRADLHEFHIDSARDTAVVTAFDPIYCDLTRVHGPAFGAATDSLFQEIDLRTHLVRREWHPLDHVALARSVEPANGVTTQWPYDFFHLNSVQRRPDGSYLISARDTSAMYLIDGSNNRVTEQIGGKGGNVRLGPGAATAFQHDAREQPGGELTVFDNGGVPMVHSQSRALVLAFNPAARTETLVAQFEHNRPIQAGSQGNVQILPNGNVFVGWGPSPYVSEYTAAGALLWDARIAGRTNSYRAYRFPWTGTPTGSPSVAAARAGSGENGTTTVYASWNGATTIASWRVLAGSSPSSLAPAATGPFAGFESAVSVPGAPAYVAVQALDSAGNVLGTSSAVSGR